MGTVVDDPLNGGGGAALGLGLDAAIDVHVLGRLQGAALDNRDGERAARDFVKDQMVVLRGPEDGDRQEHAADAEAEDAGDDTDDHQDLSALTPSLPLLRQVGRSG